MWYGIGCGPGTKKSTLGKNWRNLEVWALVILYEFKSRVLIYDNNMEN